MAHERSPCDTGLDESALSATAPVTLRWRPADGEDPEQVDAECAASLRALEACLEGDGSRQAGAPQARLEAKIDLLLVTVDRLSDAFAGTPGGTGRPGFLRCDARFGRETIEWDDPLPPPTDGTAAILEVRAAPGHPVSARLPVTLSRQRHASADAAGSGGAHIVATLAPMPTHVRDTYERCVFILHRQAVRRSTAKPVAG